MSSLYQATLSDLSVPRLAAWALALVPAIALFGLRLLFFLTRHTPPAAASNRSRPLRREPTVGN
ncbi:hypothetical protein [Arenimonas sp.]|uniref:hypothetical protein n=1 Tax=Arenimonas sp. TaxID=1872635 RepID=UPI0039E6469E